VRRSIIVVAGTIVTACALFPDLGGLAGDGGTIDSGKDVVLEAASDATTDAGVTCKPEAPFGAPQLITELDDTDDNGVPHLTHDELTIYFQRSPVGDASVVEGGVGAIDLFTAQRAKTSSPFSAPIALTAVDTTKSEWDPSVTADELSLYFASDRDGGLGKRDLYLATRTSVVTAFGPPTSVAALNTPNDECCGYVMPDGLTFYFAREESDWQMFRATRTSTTAFSVDTSGLFDQINTTSVEQTPTVTIDELTVYFASDRNGGAGGTDIWRATRATKNDPFTNPVDVSELNTVDYEYPGWISDDGCRLYFTIFGASAQMFVAKKN
jgi:hypothetical protein